MAIRANAGMNVSSRLKPILEKTIEYARADFVFKSAFPDYPHRVPYLRSILISAAAWLEDKEVVQRLSEDPKYVSRFKAVVSVLLIYFFSY